MASGTEFLIEIEQRLRGDNPVTELQKTEEALTAAKRKYAELERAAVNSGKALDKASANIGAIRGKMEAAMSAGDAGAFWKLAPALDAAIAKEQELAGKARTAKAALDAQAGEVTQLASAFMKLRSAEDAAAKAQADLAKQEKDGIQQQKALDDARKKGLERIAKTGDGLTKLPGPLGAVGGRAKELTEGWRDLSEQLGAGRAAMLVGAAAAAAFVAVLVMGAVAVASWAIGLANARRDTGLTIQALYGSAEAARAVQDSFAGVTRETGVAGDRLLAMTRDLKKAGVAAEDVPAALKALAQQESALGDSSGTSELIDKLKSGQKTVAELGSEMEEQFGSVARKKALGLDQQMTTLKENVSELFGGANIEGFLAGLARIVALFDKSTESGAALQAIFGDLMKPLGGVEGIFVAIERFILGAILAALRLGTAIKKVAKELGFDTSGLTSIVDAGDLGQVAMYVLAAAFAPVVLAIGFVASAIQELMMWWQIISAVGSAAAAGITSAWTSVKTFFAGLSLSSIGSDMISGLATGIKNNAAKVVEAITGVVNDAIASAKKLLKIQSPSRVFAEIGEQTSAGMAGGVDDGAGDVEKSIAQMIEVPTGKAAKAAGAATGGAGGAAITVSGNTFVFHGVANAEDAEVKLIDAILALLEGRAAQVGAAPEPVPT